MRPSILIADDDPYASSGIRSVLSAADGYDVLESHPSTTAGVVDACRERKPTLLVFEPTLALSEATSMLAQVQILRLHIRTVALTRYETVDVAAAMIILGVNGCALKRDPPDVLLEILEAVLRTEQGFSRSVLRLIARDRTAPHPNDSRGRLTGRELITLQQLAQGKTQKEIAETTRCSLRTVERTISLVEAKLDAPSQFVLGVRAAQLNLV